MGFAILSDIHSNIDALEAVFNDIEAIGKNVRIDEIYCLGDMIGYGCNPVEVLNLLRKKISRGSIVVGNHEDLYWGNLSEDADEKAKLMTAYNKHLIDSDKASKQFIDSLNHSQHYIKTIKKPSYRLVLSHNGPVDNYESYRYPWQEEALLPDLISQFDKQTPIDRGLKSVFSKPKIEYFFFGHTHFPTVFFRLEDGRDISIKINGKISLSDYHGLKKQILINPGSVGFPRDGKPGASYVIVDERKNVILHRRVKYDFRKESFMKAKAWLKENYENRDDLGPNRIEDLIDTIQIAMQKGGFGGNPTEIYDEGWRKYYGL